MFDGCNNPLEFSDMNCPYFKFFFCLFYYSGMRADLWISLYTCLLCLLKPTSVIMGERGWIAKILLVSYFLRVEVPSLPGGKGVTPCPGCRGLLLSLWASSGHAACDQHLCERKGRHSPAAAKGVANHTLRGVPRDPSFS